MPDHIAQMCRVEEVERPTTEVLSVCSVGVDQVPAPSWIDLLKDYILEGNLPEDNKEAAKIKRRAPSFELVDDRLYKRSFGGPLLKCLLLAQAEEVMTEVHEGICSAHQGANTLARKVILQGYYWPNLVEDCIKKIRACPVCQPFAKKETRPATYYTPVGSAIPFARWGIDILGPLPMAAGRVKFCIVAIDYFTKWAEAAPLATITE